MIHRKHWCVVEKRVVVLDANHLLMLNELHRNWYVVEKRVVLLQFIDMLNYHWIVNGGIC